MSVKDQMVGTVLRDVKLQTELWEPRINTWDIQLDIDKEAQPSEYRTANKQLPRSSRNTKHGSSISGSSKGCEETDCKAYHQGNGNS